MKKVFFAAMAAAFVMGTGAAMADDQDVKANAHANVSTPAHTHVKRSHSTTNGIGPENNAAAPGSLLPGKDRLNSRAYIKDKN